MLVKDGSGDDTNFASFGEVSRVGDVANEHISMSSAGFFIKDGGTQLGKFISKGVTIGDTSKTHISASTFNMNIVDANNNVSASFGATTTIGPVSTEHIEISSGSFKLKNGSTTNIIMNSAGMQLGSVGNGITFDTSGNATFNGSITIAPGDLPAGTVSGSAQLADAISGSSAEVSASLAAQTAATLVDSASVAASVPVSYSHLTLPTLCSV